MENILTIFILGCSFTVLLAAAVFFLVHSENMRIRKILSTVLFCNALLMLKDIFLFDEFADSNRLNISLLILNNLIIGIDFLYAYELLRTGAVKIRTVILSTGIFILLPVLYYIFNDYSIFKFSHIFSVTYIVVALICIVYFGRKYRFFVKKNYSDPSRMDVAWLKKSVLFFILIFFFWRVVYYNDNSNLFKLFYYIVSALVWVYISYRTWSYLPLLNEDMEEETVPDKAMFVPDSQGCAEEQGENGKSEDKLSQENPNRVPERISYHFEEQLESMRRGEFFCNHPKISLVELSEMLETNRTTLSYYINNVLELTFYDLTNDSRIAYAEELMKSPEFNMTQEELAVKCGFNSLSTFRRVFIDKKGCTPKKYYASLQNGSPQNDSPQNDSSQNIVMQNEAMRNGALEQSAQSSDSGSTSGNESSPKEWGNEPD